MNKKSSVIFSPDRVYNLTGFETVYFKQISPNVYKLHTAYPDKQYVIYTHLVKFV